MTELMMRDATGQYVPATPEEVLAAARQIRETGWQPRGWRFNAPDTVRDFLGMHLCEKDREIFSVLFLDTQYHLIAYEEMFAGTLDQTAVYPREVARAALRHNAHAVILAHNHPSGITAPSKADEKITRHLIEALGIIDCKVLDHVIVGQQPAYSFAEHGLL